MCRGHYELLALELDGDCLVPTSDIVATSFAMSSKGPDKIHLDQYDAFLLTGMGLGPLIVSQIYKRHRLAKHARKEQLISPACLRESAKMCVDSSPAFRIAKLIRTRSSAPIVLMPAPSPVRSVVTDPKWRAIWGERDIRRLMLDTYLAAVDEKPPGPDIVVMRQPAHTLVDAFTKALYSMRAVDPGKRSSDNYHMNGRFGLIVARAALAIIRDWDKHISSKPVRATTEAAHATG